MAGPLLDAVRNLINEAGGRYRGQPPSADIAALAQRLDEPLRIAIAGTLNSGKSTMLNALVGERLAPTDARETTRVVTWYRHGTRYDAAAEVVGEGWRRVPIGREGDGTAPDLSGLDIDRIGRLVIDWPARSLDGVTLIDTPGVGGWFTGAKEAVTELIAGEQHAVVADAVLYLLRHAHVDDVRLLEPFADRSASASATAAIAVLCRADEVGGGGTDAVELAGSVATRLRSQPLVRQLCWSVVPVAGLVAEAATTMGANDFKAIAGLGAWDNDTARRLLVSVDRFVIDLPDLTPSRAIRQALLDRLGLFGVRLAREAIASGRATDSVSLAAELRRRSGFDELRREFDSFLLGRSATLKARAVLLGLERIVRRSPIPGIGELARQIEALQFSSPELVSLRLLSLVRSGECHFEPEMMAEAERLSSAGTVADRLGIEGGGTDLGDAAARRDLLGTVTPRIDAWRRRRSHPLISPVEAEACDCIVRLYEAIVAS